MNKDDIKNSEIAEMEEFFDAVVEGYEQRMSEFVAGSMEYYKYTAELVFLFKPETLLDLGCGTGLELDEIFKLLHNVHVVGVDLSQKMLNVLLAKHKGKNLKLIHASYFDVDYGKKKFDTAVSVMTMHHFNPETKIGLYKKIHTALKDGGHYIETDYMAENKQEEAKFIAEKERLRQKHDIIGFDNFDIPFTPEHQINLLNQAGFSRVEKVWNEGRSTIILAMK